MKTEEVRYESGSSLYVVTMTEATNRVAMERTAAIRKALTEGEAAKDDPDKFALSDKHLVFAAVSPVIVAASVDGQTIACPMSFASFLDLPQRLTEVVLVEVNHRLNPQWFESVAPEESDLKKVVKSTDA